MTEAVPEQYFNSDEDEATVGEPGAALDQVPETIEFDGPSAPPHLSLVKPYEPRPETQEGLSPAEISELLERRDQGDSTAREKLINSFMPLAAKLALRYKYTSEPTEDLKQVAAVGLIKAVDRCDREKSASIDSYVMSYVLGELRRHFRDHAWHIHVDRGLKDRALEVSQVRGLILEQTGHKATLKQVADTMKVEESAIREAWRVLEDGYRPIRLDQEAENNSDGTTSTILDGVSDPQAEKAYAESTERMDVLAAIATLRSEQQFVVKALMEGQSQEQVAAQMGCSPMHVSRTFRAARAALSAKLNNYS